MAVSIQIGSTDSASNVINKQVSLRAAISATLKQPCSVEAPTFILNSNLVSSADNYLYCSDFGRYYYITDITPMTGGQQSVVCSVDPLMSYAEQIKSLTVNVSRTESTSHSNLIDSNLVTTANDEVVFLNLSGSIPHSTAQDYSYLLITAG